MSKRLDRWRERQVPRVLYGMTALASGLLLVRVTGLLPDVGPSTDLLSGFCVGSWISLAVFHLSGGAMPDDRVLQRRSATRGESSLSADTQPPALREGQPPEQRAELERHSVERSRGS